MSHTSGPWKVDRRGIVDADGRPVAWHPSVQASGKPEAELIANARLMAASPLLLAACQAALDSIQTNLAEAIWKQLADAIREATGREPNDPRP